MTRLTLGKEMLVNLGNYENVKIICHISQELTNEKTVAQVTKDMTEAIDFHINTEVATLDTVSKAVKREKTN